MDRRPHLVWVGPCVGALLAGCHDVSSRPMGPRTGDTAAAIPAPAGPAVAGHRTTRPPDVRAIDVRSIHWSADNRLLVTDSSDGSVTVWSADESRPDDPARYGRYTLADPLHEVRTQSDGRVLVENSGGKIRVRDLATGRVLRTLDQSEHVFERPFFLTPTGTAVHSFHTHRQEFNSWDVRTGKLMGVCIPKGERKVHSVIRLAADGREAYVFLDPVRRGHPDKGLWVHDGVYALDLTSGRVECRAGYDIPYTSSIRVLVMADGRAFIENSAWDLTTGKELDCRPWAHAYAVDPAGRLLVSVEDERYVVWDVRTNRALGRLPPLAVSPIYPGVCMAFSPNAKYLAIGGRRLWNSSLGLDPSPYMAALRSGNSVEYRVVRVQDQVLLLYDVQTQKRVRTLAFPTWEADTGQIPDPERLPPSSDRQ